MPATTLIRSLQQWRGRLAGSIEAATIWLDKQPTILYTGLFLVYSLFMLKQIAERQLWHDELFTFYIAQAPTLRDLLQELSQVDLNPPLLYLVTRASFHLFGASTLSCRLPDGLAFFAAMVFLGRLVARRLGNLYGFAASAMLLASPAGDLFVEARPYAFMLASLSLGWWMLEAAAEEGGWWRYALLTGAGLAAMLSHILAVPAWLCLVAAAVTFQRLRTPALVTAATLPLLCLPLLRVYVAQHGFALFPPAFQPGGETVFLFYDARIVREAILLGLTALVLLLLSGFPALRPGGAGWRLKRADWLIALLFLVLPGMLIGWFMVTHAAFWPRYGTLASLGVAVIATAILARWTNGHRSAALIVACLALLITNVPSGLTFLAHPQQLRRLEPAPVVCVPCQVQRQTHLPLVVASGLTFVEMSHREPSVTLANVYYLQDTAAAHNIAHASIFDGMATEQKAFHLGGHVVDASTFQQTHPRFLVLGTFNYPEQWLLPKLLRDGARVQLLRSDPGSYLDRELYLVETR